MRSSTRTPIETVRTIDLGHDQMLVFDGGRDGRMRVLFGATWLTREGEAGDAIVGAGSEVVFGGGRTVIEGLGQTRVQIVERRANALHPVWLRRLGHGPRQLVARLQFGVGAVQALREDRQPWLSGPLSARPAAPRALCKG